MEKIDKKILVNSPLSTTYKQWTQFEQFPDFMDNIKFVKQIDDQHLQWEISALGATKKWQAKITEQIPEHKIAWKSTNGFTNKGEIIFNSLTPNQTEIRVHIEYQPDNILEGIADKIGIVGHQVQSALAKFKTHLESQRRETGA